MAPLDSTAFCFLERHTQYHSPLPTACKATTRPAMISSQSQGRLSEVSSGGRAAGGTAFTSVGEGVGKGVDEGVGKGVDVDATGRRPRAPSVKCGV